MSKITFRGAHVRYFDVRKEKESAPFVRLHITAEMTNPVMEAMEWQPIPECVDKCNLGGILSSRNLILTPNQKELRDQEIELECSQVSDFQLHRIADGESRRTELRFIIRANEDKAPTLLWEYLRVVGQAEGALKISYSSQEKLPLGEDEPTEEGALVTAGETAEYAD